MDDQLKQEQWQLVTTHRPPPQAKRCRPGARGKPKARTGCLTCKQRRYKCDEARPTCGGCVKGNWECQYPTADAQARRRAPMPPIPAAAATTTQPRMLPRLSERDMQSFSFFIIGVVPGLESGLSTHGIRPILIQTAIAEPCVLHAALASGLATRDSCWPGDDRAERVARLESILGHYNQAIRATAELMREHGNQRALAKSRPDRLLAAMWACLLMSVTDHSCTGPLAIGQLPETNWDRALVHMRAVYVMLQECWALSPYVEGEGPPDKNSQVQDHIVEVASAASNFFLQNKVYEDEANSRHLRRETRDEPVRLDGV
ncbi:hypothetical protein MCOR02_007796 [Pyricularia oryzae]|uniref:Zn(2)-C6 fungal-type domain-containing protein n=5 Tax=Pyricularia TaxID=48558 RepID=A0ABQ8NEX6_PYRGI|nr:uncharacterized protein MGG_08753 [Pyricularia oryzae 70-15]ELQ32655.1 hypothetical protein OOU_Y34scaffold01075g11 [Pyricularia oryzae Y34]KAH9433130.1 hypothetical protein MCOR02_007796 [Pyricularia oryzae]KAI6295502.1 hypothetical protein MCOR33_007597 [Pyricularia grisea]EHA46864.1 hypothetical protein MGG_08753 [Pyricularia oryzae 70-15]KAI6255979.1 hypothetical protein MCOR19_007558 [Pyricularia oryzae]